MWNTQNDLRTILYSERSYARQGTSIDIRVIGTKTCDMYRIDSLIRRLVGGKDKKDQGPFIWGPLIPTYLSNLVASKHFWIPVLCLRCQALWLLLWTAISTYHTFKMSPHIFFPKTGTEAILLLVTLQIQNCLSTNHRALTTDMINRAYTWGVARPCKRSAVFPQRNIMLIICITQRSKLKHKHQHGSMKYLSS